MIGPLTLRTGPAAVVAAGPAAAAALLVVSSGGTATGLAVVGAALLLGCWLAWQRPWSATGFVLLLAVGIAVAPSFPLLAASGVALLVLLFLLAADAAESGLTSAGIPAWLVGHWQLELAGVIGVAAAVAGFGTAFADASAAVAIGAAAAAVFVWVALRRP